jgi:hypothetical protein
MQELLSKLESMIHSQQWRIAEIKSTVHSNTDSYVEEKYGENVLGYLFLNHYLCKATILKNLPVGNEYNINPTVPYSAGVRSREPMRDQLRIESPVLKCVPTAHIAPLNILSSSPLLQFMGNLRMWNLANVFVDIIIVVLSYQLYNFLNQLLSQF